jgi:hypothetical protein
VDFWATCHNCLLFLFSFSLQNNNERGRSEEKIISISISSIKYFFSTKQLVGVFVFLG